MLTRRKQGNIKLAAWGNASSIDDETIRRSLFERYFVKTYNLSPSEISKMSLKKLQVWKTMDAYEDEQREFKMMEMKNSGNTNY